MPPVYSCTRPRSPPGSWLTLPATGAPPTPLCGQDSPGSPVTTRSQSTSRTTTRQPGGSRSRTSPTSNERREGTSPGSRTRTVGTARTYRGAPTPPAYSCSRMASRARRSPAREARSPVLRHRARAASRLRATLLQSGPHPPESDASAGARDPSKAVRFRGRFRTCRVLTRSAGTASNPVSPTNRRARIREGSRPSCLWAPSRRTLPGGAARRGLRRLQRVGYTAKRRRSDGAPGVVSDRPRAALGGADAQGRRRHSVSGAFLARSPERKHVTRPPRSFWAQLAVGKAGPHLPACTGEPLRARRGPDRAS